MAKKNDCAETAICYDFDGTLSPGNMQEYDFFSALGGAADNFWAESAEIARTNHADPILAYMMHMIDCAREGKIRTTRQAFRDYGKHIKFYKGVEEWFDRINAFGEKIGLNISHYIVSSGIREMIENTSIGNKFRKIYACSFIYDNNDVARWPAVAVNYTTKTQFIFRINKGIEDDDDHTAINKFVAQENRRIPFSRMIYVGDGSTDIPCMRLIKELGGTSIAVYPQRESAKRQEAHQLIADQRVNFAAPADYTENSRLDKIIRTVLERIAAEHELARLRQ